MKLDAGDFELRPFEKVALPQSDKGKRIKQRDYLPHGKLPVVDQGQSDIGGYTDDESMCFSGSLPVVIFGDHTRAVKLVNHPFVVGADGIKIFSPAADVLPKYLYYWMKSAPIENRGYGRHYQYLRKLNVPVPSIAQQQAIVDEIETQFSRLDEAVANLQRVKANLKRYKASILKAAVEGRLVETEASIAQREGRIYETGEQLLQRILEERRSKWTGKGNYKEPESTNVTELGELPDGWTWVSAEQACERVVDCHNKTAPYTSAGIPLIRTTNIKDGRLLLDDTRFVDEPTYEFWSRRCPPEPGDVLFTREAPMGEAGIIPAGVKLCLGQRTMLLRPSPAIAGSFLLSALLSPVVKDLIDRVAVGSGVKHLRVGDVERLPVPLPPAKEQIRIVSEVDRHLSIIREIEVEIDSNLLRAGVLRQAVLTKNFTEPRGEINELDRPG